MKKIKLKNNEKGSASVLALVTVLVFATILTGIFAIVSSKESSQLKSEKRIKDLYGSDVERVNEIYEEVITKTLASQVNVGDYVVYNPTKSDAEGTKNVASNLLTYTSPKGTTAANTAGNGDSEQTFTADNTSKWRVLKIENNQVVLISEAPIHTLTLNSAKGYLYGEKEINEICKLYGYGYGADKSKSFDYQYGDELSDGGFKTGTITGSGARSINVDDINAACEVTPSTTLDSNYNTKPNTHTLYYPTISTADGKSTSAASRNETSTYYNYTASTYLTNTTGEPYKILFRDTVDSSDINYWLASRSVRSISDHANFIIRYVGSGGVGSNGICYSSSDLLGEYSKSSGVRPLVYLQRDIETIGKNANNEWILK